MAHHALASSLTAAPTFTSLSRRARSVAPSSSSTSTTGVPTASAHIHLGGGGGGYRGRGSAQQAATTSAVTLPPHASSKSRRRSVAAAAGVGDFFGSLFGGGAKGVARREEAKDALLGLIEGVERGVTATEEDAEAIDAAARDLERLNPNKKALASDLLNGEWELLYTTSKSIIGANKPWPFRPRGPIYQTIDVGRLRANNSETFPFFNAVDADLTPTSASNVNVQFVKFKIFGLIPVTAPESAKGALDTTYLDEDFRVSRGDRGNLFVLRMTDPEKRLIRKGDEDEE